MASNKIDIFVFTHWQGLIEPKFMGTLSAHFAKGRKAFSFEYDKNWINSEQQILLDPTIKFYTGPQFSETNDNFGLFLDSMPDTWGRTLMKRRSVLEALKSNKKNPILYDIDYLLAVYDDSRMGALRFKTDMNGAFLDNNVNFPTPPWSSIRELQVAAKKLEDVNELNDIGKWLEILIAPGSSLGGARPKANILDENGELWIAKFPSKNDQVDKAAWEYLAYQLAINSKIEMSPSKIEKINGNFHTFFTKRFDRIQKERIHFASAMTMTGNNEETLKIKNISYLDIADFIQNYCVDVEENLKNLWRRMVFNIAISNTDDHLRNHGFILSKEGWNLSPAYDLNPSTEKFGLALNIDMESNALDFDLAINVGVFFRLTESEMKVIIDEVLSSVQQWKIIAKKIGISGGEQELMKDAFRVKL